MLNEDILLQELKKDFDKTLDQVDKKINTDIYNILPCYMKKKLILKITKEELINGTYSWNNGSRYISLNKHLEIDINKKYYIKFLNQEFSTHLQSSLYGIIIGYEDSVGDIFICPNLYHDAEQNKEITDKEYFEIGLIDGYVNIETDLEIYEIAEFKKIDTNLMPEIIYLENKDSNISISPDGISLDKCFRFYKNLSCLNIYKPISFSSVINDDDDDNILVNKKYVDSKSKNYTLREVFDSSISKFTIDDFFADSFKSTQTWIINDAQINELAYLNMDYYLQINGGRTYKLYHSYRDNLEYLHASTVMYIDKEKDLKLYIYVVASKENTKLVFEKNKTTAFNCTCESVFHPLSSALSIQLYEIDKSLEIKDGAYLPSNATISNSLQVGTNYNDSNGKIQGDRSISVGERTVARGANSAAIGMCVESDSTGQLVFGTYNDINKNQRYVMVVGNGTGASHRSNGCTIDTSGNGWFKSDVYVGGNNQDEGNKLLSTKDISFNENGELVVTINGVTKIFVPKSE